jgi:hypothetical protein
MKADQPMPDLSGTPGAASGTRRRQRIPAAAAIVALICTGATSCTRTQIALSSAAIGVVVVGTAVGVTYAVKHHLHTLEGCVSSDASGLALHSSDTKVYTLRGETVGVKAGERVMLHGSRVKNSKGTFEVQQLKKDYGPCSVGSAPSTSSMH